jgi:hypothetical protein
MNYLVFCRKSRELVSQRFRIIWETYLVHGEDVLIIAAFLLDRILVERKVLLSLVFFLELPVLSHSHFLLQLALVSVSGVEQLASLFGRNIR